MNEPEHSESVFATPSQFNTTHWSVVLLAGKAQSALSSAALEKLCRTYWHPLYAFARRKGYTEEDAKDLTQQFFACLLERNDFESVDPHKGKFRTFLLTSFTHFLCNENDRARTAKRGGGQVIFSLDAMRSDQFEDFQAQGELTPDRFFDLRWALTVMEQALSRLRTEMAAGKAEQFEAFKKFLTEEPGEGEYASVAQRLGVAAPTVAVSVHRLRNRYRELVQAEVAQTVRSPLELEEEMRHLCDVLSS
jgi:RNA polymerase sigma-70 factor (ECF subfamily)